MGRLTQLILRFCLFYLLTFVAGSLLFLFVSHGITALFSDLPGNFISIFSNTTALIVLQAFSIAVSILLARLGLTESLYSFFRYLLLVTVLFGAGSVIYGGLSSSYTFHWAEALEFLPRFNEGLWVTLQVAGLAALLAIVLGLTAALGRLSKWQILRDLTGVYVHSLRNLPFIVVVLIFFFGLRHAVDIHQVVIFGHTFRAPFIWGVIALGIYESSYMAEIFRAGILSVHKTQVESARSLGMTYAQSMRYVIVPQATKAIIPPMTGTLIALVKESALLSLISLPEVTHAARQLILPFRRPYFFEFYAILAAYYLAIVVPLSLFSQWIESRTGIRLREVTRGGT